MLGAARMHQLRPAQWIEIDLALGAGDGKLVARDIGMPAHVHDTAHTSLVLNHCGGVVLDRPLKYGFRHHSSCARGFPEQVIHNIDTVAGNIEEWSSSGELWIEEPGAERALRGRCSVAVCFGQHRLPD